MIVTIIPARGGSKRIPNKNIYPIAGKPLLAYTLEAALESNAAGRIVVSTDSEQIAQVAIDHGVEVIHRPADISHDTASTESALIYTLDQLDFEPESVLTLPATSPLRTAATIRAFVEAFQPDQVDAMISLTENRGDFWQNQDGKWQRLFPNAPRRRQDRTPLYEENSALYITRTAALHETGSILGRSVTGFVIDAIEAVDINEPMDLLWAEFLLKQRQ